MRLRRPLWMGNQTFREETSATTSAFSSTGSGLTEVLAKRSFLVYGWLGFSKTSDTKPSSTIFPFFITQTRFANLLTSPRSCVIKRIPISVSFLNSTSKSNICDSIVTSSAVVGSSAIKIFGLFASAIAIITR